jgi:hypothetical protein
MGGVNPVLISGYQPAPRVSFGGRPLPGHFDWSMWLYRLCFGTFVAPGSHGTQNSQCGHRTMGRGIRSSSYFSGLVPLPLHLMRVDPRALDTILVCFSTLPASSNGWRVPQWPQMPLLSVTRAPGWTSGPSGPPGSVRC